MINGLEIDQVKNRMIRVPHRIQASIDKKGLILLTFMDEREKERSEFLFFPEAIRELKDALEMCLEKLDKIGNGRETKN